jgi:uncharacterized protein YdiU (UPF0061 family)
MTPYARHADGGMCGNTCLQSTLPYNASCDGMHSIVAKSRWIFRLLVCGSSCNREQAVFTAVLSTTAELGFDDI